MYQFFVSLVSYLGSFTYCDQIIIIVKHTQDHSEWLRRSSRKHMSHLMRTSHGKINHFLFGKLTRTSSSLVLWWWHMANISAEIGVWFTMCTIKVDVKFYYIMFLGNNKWHNVPKCSNFFFSKIVNKYYENIEVLEVLKLIYTGWL